MAAATPMTIGKRDTSIGTFVWEVVPKGGLARGARPDYLFGTMHVPMPTGRTFPPGVAKLVKRAKRFVMEVDDANVDGAKVAQYAASEPGQDLKTQLTAARWKRLVALAGPRGLGEEELRGLDPWFVALAFLPQPTPGQRVLDDVLKATAKAANVPVKYLETADEQLAALDGVAQKEDLAQLIEIIDDPKKPEAEMEELESAYLAGDLPKVEGYLFDPSRVKAYPDFYEKLFDARNRKWLPQLEATMKREDAFVAVGLGHLLGARGLVRQLQGRGWAVRRIQP